MKNFFFFGALILCVESNSQQIPNGNFEIWGLYNTWTLEPQDWDTPNNQIMTPVIQDLDAYEGEFAMKVNVLPGFEGAIQQIATTSFPVTAIPSSLQFMVKANVPDSDELDNVSVTAEFRLNGAIVYTETLGVFETVSTWQTQTINFVTTQEAVDEVRIHVAAGYVYSLFGGSWDTWISVDEMKFLPETKVFEILEPSIIFYPVPCNDVLNVSSSALLPNRAEISIFDAEGLLVFTSKFSKEIDLKKLNAGNYLVVISSDSEIIDRRLFCVK